MSTVDLRVQLKKLYSNPKWQKRVDSMSDNQVFAIVQRLRKQHKL